jgi:hypothetical protein
VSPEDLLNGPCQIHFYVGSDGRNSHVTSRRTAEPFKLAKGDREHTSGGSKERIRTRTKERGAHTIATTTRNYPCESAPATDFGSFEY